jgi:predicted esterase
MKEDDRLYSTQSLWDNSMGESCALALDQNPGYSVVHVNGGFHSSHWDGTVEQLKKRKPNAKVKTVSIVPATSPSSARQHGAPVADYVVLAEQRATNLNDGRWSVNVSREAKYQLHLPAAASSENRVPLLIWLGNDGQSSDEGLQYWRSAFGQHAAIVVLDPPYRELQRDFSNSGRWFWSDNFSGDVSAMVGAIERSWSYAIERYPIDPSRVCLAGEGTGATVVAAATLLTERMSLNAVAIQPRQYAKLKDYPLPLLEDWGSQSPPRRTLQIIAGPSDSDWWKKELQEYESVGLSSKWTDAAVDPWVNFGQTETAIRTALNVSSSPTVEIISRRYIHVDSNSPLHLIWSRLAAQRASTDGALCVAVTVPPASDDATSVSVCISPEDLTKPNTIPKCPGSFGGTTVLVVDGNSDETELASWLELEKSDPLNKQSRFHRLRIATTGSGDRGLQKVLAALQEQKRTNVLIVPAKFYAGESLMRELENQTADHTNQMTLQWLPGLGGQPLAISNR